MLIRFSFFILLAILSLPFAARAQKPPECKSGEITFSCLKNFQTKINDSSDVFAAFDSKKKIGVFVFSPSGKLSDTEAVNNALKGALKTLYATDYYNYQWKESNDYQKGDSWSKYEEKKFAKAGFNNKYNHTVHVQLVRLSINKKDVVAGYVYEMANGINAGDAFKRWYGGGNGDATDALQELVIKITGENRDKFSTPGGPPPPAE